MVFLFRSKSPLFCFCFFFFFYLSSSFIVNIKGNAWYLCESDSCIISYENITFKNGTGAVWAQAEIFVSGAIELRYGSETTVIGSSFAAGVQDNTQSILAPVTFGACSLEGICSAGQPYPSNQGLRFTCKYSTKGAKEKRKVKENFGSGDILDCKNNLGSHFLHITA